MDKIKHFERDLSLRKSIVLYVSVFVIFALALNIITAFFCTNAIENIRNSYPPTGEKYYLTNEKGEQLGNGTYIGTVPALLSKEDQSLISMYEFIPFLSVPLYSALCIIAAALLFYRNKLKKPLAELKMAAKQISNNNLNFSIAYKSKNELGQLCTSFEMMRSALASNFSEMWRQAEERKQLNAAFAHDLRTPLTVLKGYDEILQTSDNIKTKETAITMEKHISCLEHYITSMSNMQRLEDMQPECKMIYLQNFLSSLSETASILCMQSGKNLFLHNKTTSVQLSIDTEFVSQVINNFISNSVRYAKTSITLSFEEQNNGLLLFISDDGKGFSENSLHKAANPYFTEENHSKHFGLGLYICKLLCEHHKGYLKVENTFDGAKVTAFFKSFDL